MKVLFVASELTPIAKVGGLGDVMEALPKALARLGIDVSVVIPRYGFIDKKNLKLVAENISVPLANAEEKISLYKTSLPGASVTVFLVENEDYWTHAPEPYYEQTAFVGAKPEIQRFVFFSKAVFTLISQGILKVDVVHCNDWHTGVLVSLLKRKSEILNPKSETPKVIFTIHNLSNQGRWDAEEIDEWFLGKGERSLFTRLGKDYDFIAEGILNADKVTTVSKTYAEEILTKKYGEGLQLILRKRKKDITGILNGIDYEFYDPASDKFIFANYNPDNILGKMSNKAALQKALGFGEYARTPLFGMVARLTNQKGVDFITSVLEDFLIKYDSQFVFLGKGVKEYEDQLLAMQGRFPNRVRAQIGFDEPFAHRIYAASDFFLMPSRFEPSGLGQMIAMRYGTIPIVRATGGLKDSVKHLRTGFVFERESPDSFLKILRLAWGCYADNSKKIKAMQKNCFKENFDFSRSAREYQKLYKKLI